MSQPDKPMSKAEQAGTLLSIIANLGPALSLPELSQIKSRLFALVNLDIIPGKTLNDLQMEEQASRMTSWVEDELAESEPHLEVVDKMPEKPA